MPRSNKRTKTDCGQELKIEHDPLPVMEEMWRQGQLCDAVLQAKGRQFSVHRVVLASAIPFFKSMFTGDMVEARNKETELKDMDAIALEALINFAYTGRLNLEEDNVQSIMVAADYLQVVSVRDACADYLLQRMDSQNALGLERFARLLGCTSVADEAAKYVDQNFCEISKHKEYLALSPTDVVELLDKDNLWVEGEEQVLEACLLWVKQSAAERKEHLPRLLAAVRLSLLTPDYIRDHVATEDLVRSSSQCGELVKEALDFHSAPVLRSQMPKSGFKTAHRLGGLNGRIYVHSDVGWDVRHYDVRTNEWTLMSKTERYYPGIAVHDGKFYMIGGVIDITMAGTQVYDFIKEEWSTVSPMPSRRYCMGVAAHGDHVYVCGGYDVNERQSKLVERYDPGTDSWCRLAPMKTARQNCAAISYLGFIYVLGGVARDGSSLRSVERYDPVRNTWSEAPPMLQRRRRFGVAMLRGKLYACGGGATGSSSHQRSVEVFHPQTNRWTYVASTNDSEDNVTLAASMGKLWAVNDTLGPYRVEVYDPSMNAWTVV